MTKPRLKKMKLHGGDLVQLTISTAKVPNATTLSVEYEHEGQRCKSVGTAEHGVPVPAGAKILSYGLDV
jgi:hypothetical protein